MSNVTIIDYGICNLHSVANACFHLGVAVDIRSDPSAIRESSLLILPGVGAFGDGIANLCQLKLVEPLRDAASQGKPILGICLGMQLLFDSSEEFGQHEGLGLLKGSVKRIPNQSIDGDLLRLPHIGWNELHPCRDWSNSILKDTPAKGDVYFVHSYAAWPTNEKLRWADTFYKGQRAAAVVGHNNIWGCQFHPERSGLLGLQILKNFLAVR
jgi:glutamine amidotransferase